MTGRSRRGAHGEGVPRHDTERILTLREFLFIRTFRFEHSVPAVRQMRMWLLSKLIDKIDDRESRGDRFPHRLANGRRVLYSDWCLMRCRSRSATLSIFDPKDLNVAVDRFSIGAGRVGRLPVIRNPAHPI
jgi:hypothetical protein